MADESTYNDDFGKKALERAEALLKAFEKNKKVMDGMKSASADIASFFLKTSKSDFFKQVPKTSEDFSRQLDTLRDMSKEIQKAERSINETFDSTPFAKELKKAFDGAKSASSLFSKSISESISGLKSQDVNQLFKELGGEFGKQLDIQKDREKIEAKIRESFSEQQISASELNDILKIYNNSLGSARDSLGASQEDIDNLLTSQRELVDLVGEAEAEELLRKMHSMDLAEFLKEEDDITREILRKSGIITDELAEQAKATKDLNVRYSDIREEALKTEKTVFSIGKGLGAWAEQTFTINGLFDKLSEFDKLINDTQKQTGINFDANATKMTLLTSKTAEFGMSMEDTFQTMAGLADELNTTDFDLLAGAADDLKAVQLATGISAENMNVIAGEMMRTGQSSDDVAKFITKANASAKMFGVSSKKVLEDISKNMSKMRTMGFAGGEESLIKMAAQANRLRIEVDEIFNVAKKARTIEGAMEMAAELQLAAGSFSNINPMDLLAAARKGPKELGNILTQMGKDVGHFNQETGKYEFDPVDVDRLQIVADATGMSLDAIQQMISKNAEDNKKLDLFPQDMFNIEGFDPEEVKSQFSDALEIGKNGELTVKGGSILDKNGIKDVKDLSKMSKGQIQELMNQQKADAENLEEQARQNETLKQSMDNFVNAVMNLMTVMQPFLEFATKIITTISKVFQALPDWSKLLIGGLMGTFVFLLAGMKTFGIDTLKGFKSIFSGIGSMFKGAGGMLGFGKGGPGGGGGGTQIPDGTQNAAGQAQDIAGKTEKLDGKKSAGFKEFMINLRDGLSEFGSKFGEVIKGALALSISLALVGGALAGVTLAFAALGGDFTQLIMFGLAMVELGLAFYLMSKAKPDIKNIAILSLAMVIVGAALIPFALAAQMFTDVDWGSFLIAVGVLTLAMVGMALLGAALSGPVGAMLLAGAGMLIIAGVSLAIASVSLLIFAAAANNLAAVDWAGFSEMGGALLSVVPGLLGFAFAGLAFVNPIMLIGIMSMIGVLTALSAIMIPLGSAFDMAGKGMTAFVSGIEKLQTATSNINLASLESLQGMAESFSNMSAAATVASAMASFAEGAGGARGGGGGSRREHVVNIKINGRDIKQLIIDDTELQA